MGDDLAARLTVFFAVLDGDPAGRDVLAEGEETIHFRLSDDRGLALRLGAAGATAQAATAHIDPAADVTRLICDTATLNALIAGRLSFWEAVIPMWPPLSPAGPTPPVEPTPSSQPSQPCSASEPAQPSQAIVFGDNWMAKKQSINRFGRMCRMAQERHGFVARDAGQPPAHVASPGAATRPSAEEV